MHRYGKTFSLGVIALACLVALATSSCAPKKPAAPATVRIGAVLPLTGPLSFLGGPERDVLTMAAQEVNAAGGINGKQVELLIEDSQASAKDGVTALQKVLLSEPIAVLTSLTIVSNATLPILAEKQIPQIALSVHPTLVNGTPNAVRPYYGFEDEMKTLASYAKEQKVRRLAVLWVNVPECEAALTKVLTPELQAAGIEIVASESYDLSTTNLRPQLTKVAGAKPDLVFVMDFGTLMGTILKEAQSLGIRGKIVSGIGLLTAPPIEPALVNGVPFIGPRFVIDNAQPYQEFAQRFANATKGTANYDVLYTYDAFMLVVQALRQMPAPPERKGVIPAIHALGAFTGIGGDLRVQADGNVTVPVAMGTYKDGVIQPLAPRP